jgi:hypothetical protein
MSMQSARANMLLCFLSALFVSRQAAAAGTAAGVGLGLSTSCVIRTDGSLVCFGDGGSYALGYGNTLRYHSVQLV